MSIRKNHNKIKLASDKTHTKQSNLYFIKKDMGPGLNASGQQVDKKSKEVQSSNILFYF